MSKIKYIDIKRQKANCVNLTIYYRNEKYKLTQF